MYYVYNSLQTIFFPKFEFFMAKKPWPTNFPYKFGKNFYQNLVSKIKFLALTM